MGCAGRRSKSPETSCPESSSTAAAATSSSRGTGSTSRSSMRWRPAASPTRRSGARRLRRSIAAMSRRRFCSGRRRSRTCLRGRARGGCCRRRRPTSSRSSPQVSCFNRLTDWLATCRAAVEDVRGVLAELPTRVEREPIVGAGKGGDDTVAIDAAAEDAIVRRLDATRAEVTLVAEKAAQMVGIAYRLRIMGSLALSLCHLAAGRIDAVCSLKDARAVDIAAAQLLVRECGLAIDLPEAPPFGQAPLDTEGRSRVVAAGTPELCQGLFAALDR